MSAIISGRECAPIDAIPSIEGAAQKTAIAVCSRLYERRREAKRQEQVRFQKMVCDYL